MRKDWKREYFSIPNLMGYFRILLIPVFAWCYLRADSTAEYLIAAVVLGISSLTDFFDGKVARRFNQVTEFGKALDPVADKLTQCVVVVCLCTRYPILCSVVGVFVVKESMMLILGLISLKVGKKLDGAHLCGKISTAVLDITMILLLLLPSPGNSTVNFLAMLCLLVLLYSMISYILIYIRLWSGKALRLNLTRGQRILKNILIGAAILAYFIVGFCLSTLPQGEISEEAAEAVDTSVYYSDSVGGDRAQILSDNAEALDARIRMIAQAEERILFSTFDIRADEAGTQVLAALLDAAERGVQVEMLVDGFRSWLYMEGCSEFLALSSHPNVEIRLYNQVNVLLPWTYMGRMHDKYIIVDDDLYLLGGRNTFSYFLGETDGKHNYDWDVLIWNDGSEEGSLSQLEDYFYSIWDSENVSVFHNNELIAEWPSVQKASAQLKQLYEQLQEDQPELFEPYDYAAVTCETDQVTLLSNPTNITSKEPVVFYTIMQLIGEADEADFHTPYIISNDWMLDMLAEAGSDTDLTIMTNSVANNGNLFGAAFYRQVKGTLLDMGISLLEFDGGVSYHGKVITMDNTLSLVGSYNLDLRSTYVDTELMLVIDSEAFCTVLQAEMDVYEEQCLTVIDAETSTAPENTEAQALSGIREALLDFISVGLGWAKFLM